MKRSQGFTVIEIVVVIFFISFSSIILLIQKNNTMATQRDSDRKTAINAMHYSLEEVFYEQNGYYPQSIDSKTLRSVDPSLFTDPNGIKIGEKGSDYRYEANACDNIKCKGYVLSTKLEKEDTYEKKNR